MSDAWQWNGSRWWRVDFHAHSMASSDYGKDTPDQSSLRTRPYEDWLKDFMRAEIDCVVIADHNTGAGIDQARSALTAMAGSGDPEYRTLFLLPGIELSVQGGVHILAILPAETSTSDVDTLLGVVGYRDAKGSSTGVTREPAAKVIEAIGEMGGIAIPAHVDDAAGLFSLSEATLRQSLTAKSLIALESRNAALQPPPGIRASELPLAIITGSDSHHPSGNAGQSYPGSRYTWVKMSSPTLQGLQLALMDGPLSLARSDGASVDPNRVPALTIESIAVADATYIGKSAEFMLSMSPWLNAVVGGRGTGKSTVVEFLRQALQRRAELPDEFSEEHAKYETVDGEDTGGLLGPNTTVVITYRKDETRFRVRWAVQDRGGSIEEETATGWTPVPGDIASRFPVRIYSQKQVFHLARDPQALLKVIDEAPPVDGRTWRGTFSTNRSRFLALRAQAREIEASLSRESELKGELEDVRRLLDLFDRSNHAAVLRSYRDASREDVAVRKWDESWSDAGDRVREVAATITPDSLNDPSLSGGTQELGELRRHAEEVRVELAAVADRLLATAASIDTIYARWTDLLKGSPWRATVDAAVSAHADLVTRLEDEGVSSPGEYADLVARQTVLEQELVGLADRRAESGRLRAGADDLLRQIQDDRRALSDLRNEFLKEVLKGNRYVRIRVVKYGAVDGVERSFRRLIDRSDGAFARVIGAPSDSGGILGGFGSSLHKPNETERQLAEIKRTIRDTAEGRVDQVRFSDSRFVHHVQQLRPEALDRLDLWFPEDSLSVKYSRAASGKDFVAIHQGSPGQKTAALLAFLMSYGSEPLILDQPEDDLDNHLIYDLIVAQLRETKFKRQVLVVTHNPNIVVNGDAELVIALSSPIGQTTVECQGSLQEQMVRDLICQVMEGGREAFEQRYRRMAISTAKVAGS